MNQVLISSMQAINEKRFILSWLVFTITLSLYGYQIMEFGLGLQLFLVTGKLCWFLIEFDDEFFVYSYLKDLYETRIAQYERKLKTKGKFWDILLKKEPSTDRLYHLDALRGLACLIILTYNILRTPIVSEEYLLHVGTDSARFYNIKRFGDLALGFFVVLSGFILSNVYWNERSKHLKELLTTRAIRFYPMHWATAITFVCLNAYYVTHYDSKWKFTVNAEDFTKCLSLTSMWFKASQGDWNFQTICNGPAWSLSVEWLVNIIMFISIRFLPIHLSLFLFELFAYLGYYSSMDGSMTEMSTTGPLYYAFFFGVVFHKMTYWINFKYRGIQLVFDILTLTHISNWESWIAVDFAGNPSSEFQFTRINVVSFSIALIFYLNNSFLMKNAFANPLFVFLGKISFSLYLSHFSFLVVFEILQHHGYSPLNSDGSVFHLIILVVLFSAFVHYCFEIPATEYINAIIGKNHNEKLLKIDTKKDLEYQKLTVLHSAEGEEEDMAITPLHTADQKND